MFWYQNEVSNQMAWHLQQERHQALLREAEHTRLVKLALSQSTDNPYREQAITRWLRGWWQTLYQTWAPTKADSAACCSVGCCLQTVG